MIEDAIRTKLLANTTLAGYIGTRIYPTYLPQDAALPAIVYQQIDSPEHHDIDVAYPMYQFSIFGITYAAVKAIAAEIYTALQREKGTWSGHTIIQGIYKDGRDLFDINATPDTTKIYGYGVDYRIVYRTK
jgi:hypothetical protein